MHIQGNFIALAAQIVKFQELEIGEVIGRGSFATVNRGKWKGKDVAVKRIRIPPGYETEDVFNHREISILRFVVRPC